MPKKKNRRTSTKNAALKPSMNLKTRTEEIRDIDYLDKLNDKEKEWLNNFNEEWINASLNHSGTKLHKTKKARKIIYDRNNARNRDVFTKEKAVNQLKYLSSGSPTDKGGMIKGHLGGEDDMQDRMILEYDLKYNNVKRKDINEYMKDLKKKK